MLFFSDKCLKLSSFLSLQWCYSTFLLGCPDSLTNYLFTCLVSSTVIMGSAGSQNEALSAWTPIQDAPHELHVSNPSWHIDPSPTVCSRLCASPHLLIYATHLTCHSNGLIYSLKWHNGPESQWTTRSCSVFTTPKWAQLVFSCSWCSACIAGRAGICQLFFCAHSYQCVRVHGCEWEYCVYWAASLKARKWQVLTGRLTGPLGVGQETDLAPLIEL